MRKIRTNLLNPISPTETRFLEDHIISWNSNGIQSVQPFDPQRDKDAEDKTDLLCLPGNIDLHTHLSQHRIRGIYEPSLLDWLQTHLSENPREVSEVLKLFNAESYTQVYDDFGLFTPKSILAHAIHLSEKEMETLAKRQCKVAHCPDSNFFLKSGEMDWQGLEAKGVQIGLGSDVAAGSSLDMFYHAKMANYRQSNFSLSPERLFHTLTLGNAKLLGLDHRIGSLEPGKEADLCFRRLPSRHIDPANLLSVLCFCSEEFPVVEAVVASKTVFSTLEGQLH